MTYENQALMLAAARRCNDRDYNYREHSEPD
jgi:hypothetical protein